jgi:hypothetical protein
LRGEFPLTIAVTSFIFFVCTMRRRVVGWKASSRKMANAPRMRANPCGSPSTNRHKQNLTDKKYYSYPNGTYINPDSATTTVGSPDGALRLYSGQTQWNAGKMLSRGADSRIALRSIRATCCIFYRPSAVFSGQSAQVSAILLASLLLATPPLPCSCNNALRTTPWALHGSAQEAG